MHALVHSWMLCRLTACTAVSLLNLAHPFSSCLRQLAMGADFKLCPEVQGPNPSKTKLKMTPYDSSESVAIFSASSRLVNWEKRATEKRDDLERRLVKDRVQNKEWGRNKETKTGPKDHQLDSSYYSWRDTSKKSNPVWDRTFVLVWMSHHHGTYQVAHTRGPTYSPELSRYSTHTHRHGQHRNSRRDTSIGCNPGNHKVLVHMVSCFHSLVSSFTGEKMTSGQRKD